MRSLLVFLSFGLAAFPLPAGAAGAGRGGNGRFAHADRLRESAEMTPRMTRRFQRRGAVLIACLVAAGGARAQDDWAATRESFLCKSNTEVREIKTYVSNASGGDAMARGCRVDYIKNGKTQTIWSSRSSRSYCEGKASRLAARLEASHFSCSPLRLQRSGEG
jgi:hypothetical protein